MLKLSAFADEIGPTIDQQVAVMREAGVTHFELRNVDGENVLTFSGGKRDEIRKKIVDAGQGVVSIGSPCGKKPIDTPREQLLDMFKKAIEQAQFFDAPLIRVFSFYPEGGEGKGPIEPIRDRAIDLLRAQAELLEGTSITMVHENEKGIYGDIGSRCVELLAGVKHERFKAAFDFANFVQCGQDPLECWPDIKPYTIHIHIKDAIKGSGKVVPAGQGDGHIPAILKDFYASGYREFLTLEPHLKVAGHSHGETGPELFHTAVRALRNVCEEQGIPLAS